MSARDEGGFTLIELLVAMTLSLIVLGATLDAFAGFSRNSRAVNVKNDAQQDVRASTDQLARELRNAISSGSPTAPLENAAPFDLMFQTVQGSADARVRYCLDNSTPSREVLLKQTQSPPTVAAPSTTNCPSSDPAWTQTATVADWLVNRYGYPGPPCQDRDTFVYSSTPPSLNPPRADITGIQTNLFLNRGAATTCNTPPKTRDTELTSAVRLRNTNRSPTAAFTWTQQNGVLLNGSNSQDPEGGSLTFEWKLDNGPFIAGNVRQSYPTLTSASGHTFKLRVTDPEGATNTQTVQVQ